MSKTVDAKVVEMRFDNKQFESGARITLSTLDRLKEALKLPDTSKALKGIDQSVKGISLNGIAAGVDALNKKFSTLGIVGMTVVSNVTNALMGKLNNAVNMVTNSIVSGGIKRAMNIENAHFQLQALLKDESKVQAVMADAMESVDGTAYAYDEAAKAASQFAASGLKAGDEMLGALKGITGVAAMTNSDFQSIATIFTTVAGNGRLMGDQLLQLSSRGLNVASTLADYFKKVRKESNITEGDIREMVTKGQLDFKTFAEAMTWAFGDSAKRANETFNGALSNMKSALARIGAGFVSPLVEQNGELVNLFNALRIKINEVKGELVFDEQRSAVNGLTMATSLTNKQLDKMFDKIEKKGHVTVKQLDELDKNGASAMESLTTYINGVADGSIRASYATKTAIDKLTKGNEVAADKVKKFVEKGKINFAMFTSAMEHTYGKERTLTKQFTDFFLDTVKNITEMVNKFDISKPMTVFYRGLNASKNVLKGLLSVLVPVKNAFSEVYSLKPYNFLRLSSVLVDITAKMKLSETASNNLHDTFKGLFDFTKLLIDIFVDLVSAILPIEKPVLEMGDSFLDLTGYLGRMLSKFTEAARESEYLGKAIEFIASGVKKGITGFSDLVKWLIKIVKEVAKFKPVTKTVGLLTKAFVALWKLAGPYVSKFKDVLVELSKEFSKFANSAIGKSVEFISKSFETLFNQLKSFSLKDVIGQLKTFKSSVKSFNSTSSDNAGTAAFIQHLKEYGKALKEALSFDSALGRLEGIMKTMGKFITWIRDTFGPALQELNFGSALIAFGFVGIIRALNQATSGFSSLSKTFEKLPGTLTSVREALNAYQTKLKAESLEAVAKAIAILAASLVILSFADPKRLVIAATAIGIAGSTLFTSFSNILKAAHQGQEANAALNKFANGFSGLLNKFGRSLEIKAIGGALKNLGIAMALIVASIIALGIMYNENKTAMEAGLKAVEEIVAIIGGIMLLGGVLIGGLKDHAKDFKALGIGMVGLGVSLLLAVVSIKKVMEMEIPKDYGTRIVILIGVFGALSALCLVLAGASRLAGEGKIAMGSLIGLAALLYVSVMALNKLFKMKLPNDLGEKLLIFGALFAGLAVLLVAMGALGSLSGESSQAKDIGSLGNLLLKTVASLTILAQMDSSKLMKGAVALGLTILAVGGSLALASKIQSAESAKSIQAMSAVITTITTALGILALMPLEQLVKAAGSLTIVIGSIAFALGQASKNTDKSSYGAIIAMIGIVVVITTALYFLSQQPWEGLLAGGTALGEVLLALSISIAIISKVKIDQSAVNAFMLGLIGLTVIAATLYILAEGNWQAMIPIATAISEVMLALSVAMGICAVVGKIAAGGAIPGLIALDLFIANLAAVCVALGALSKIDGFQELVSGGGQVLVQLGQILGDFVGAIIGGIINGITDTLPQLANNLSMFMILLTPFLAGLQMITESMIQNAVWLTLIIAALLTEGFINSLLIVPGLGLVAIALELDAFMTSLQPFIDKVSDIKPETIEACKNLAAMIMAFTVSDVINGISSLLGLSGNLSDFGDQLKDFGPGIVEFAKSVNELTKEDVEKAKVAAEVGQAMADLSKGLYGSGGFIQKLFGEKDLGDFANNITSYGDAIVGFADKVKDVDPSAVEGAKTVGEIMSELQSNLTPMGGVMQFFTGTQSLTRFGVSLKLYGQKLVSFLDEVKNVKSNDVIGVQTVTRVMTLLSEGLPNQQSVFGKLFNGDDSFAGFGKNLESFGKYIVAFIDQVDGANFGAIDEFKNGMDKLIQVAKDSEGLSFESLMGLGSLGAGDAYSGLNGFVSAIGDAKADAQNQVKGVVDGMMATLKSYNPQFQSAGLMAITNFLKGFKSNISASFVAAINSIISAIRSTYSSFAVSGGYVAQGFISGIKSYNRSAYLAGFDLGSEAVKGTKKATEQKSPSKVMRQVGNYTGLGFILGFKSFIQEGYKTGVLLGESAIEGATYGLEGMSKVLTDSDFTSPVIRPRADLSGIQQSANQVSDMFNQALRTTTVMAKDVQLKMGGRMSPSELVANEVRGLRLGLAGAGGDTYNISGIDYSESPEVGDALKTIIRVANIKRRV